jgi:hypothetical protein
MIRLPSIDAATLARLITLDVESSALRSVLAGGTARAASSGTEASPIDHGRSVPPLTVVRVSDETQAAVSDLQRLNHAAAGGPAAASSEYVLLSESYRQVQRPLVGDRVATAVAVEKTDPFVQQATAHSSPTAIPVSVAARSGEVGTIAHGSDNTVGTSMPIRQLGFLSSPTSIRLMRRAAGIILIVSVVILTLLILR